MSPTNSTLCPTLEWRAHDILFFGSPRDDNNARPVERSKTGKQDPGMDHVDPDLLMALPVVVCVAMYRSSGALEANVNLIGRTEGVDLWHFS